MKINLGHGSGGKLSHQLITDIFIKHFDNEILNSQTDSAVLELGSNDIAFTTDSYVIDPIFFPGGNIGKLAVCGTVNDLSVSGAVPEYISCSFIIEEGFSFEQLNTIVASMASEAQNAGIKIVTGDTKVVNKGKCDKLFINTTGIGIFKKTGHKLLGSGETINPGDQVIVNGSIGDHGISVLAARESLHFQTTLHSDCASLNNMIRQVLDNASGVRFMRDATRGGLATVLNEVAGKNNFGLDIWEESINIKDEVKEACEIFGFDPLHLANEGKVVMIVDKASSDEILHILKENETGRESVIIGEVTEDHPKKVVLHTGIGGKRWVDMLSGEQLPRIC